MPDRVVTITLNPAVDRSCRTDRVVPDVKLDCEDVRRDPGGGGINVARALTRLGITARAMWSGGGPMATVLARLLEAEAVRQEPVPIEGVTRENLFVHESMSDRFYRFNMPGAPLTAAEQEFWIRRMGALTPRPRVVAISGSLPPGCSPQLMSDLIREIEPGVQVVLDTSGEALMAGLDAGVCLVKPNLRELASVAGYPLESEDAIAEAARRIVQSGSATMVLVSMGSDGAMLVTHHERHRVHPPQVHVRSKVGAGDSTVAGAVLGLVNNWSPARLLRMAVAAGTAAAMTDGTELCRAPDVQHLFERLERGEAAA